jgi:hypothetical protein
VKYRLKGDHSLTGEIWQQTKNWVEFRVFGDEAGVTSSQSYPTGLFERMWEPVPWQYGTKPSIEEQLEIAADAPEAADFWLRINRPNLLRRAAAEIRRLKAKLADVKDEREASWD